MLLYHYYDKSICPFVDLSDLLSDRAPHYMVVEHSPYDGGRISRRNHP